MNTQTKSQIIANTQVSPDFYEMQLSASPPPAPGQFFTIRASDSTVPLLRRPFAYSSFDPKTGTASMIYQKLGPATEIMASKQPGDTLDIIGPLGIGFEVQKKASKHILVAGGVGLGPVLFLADHLKESGLDYTFVFGCRTKAQIPDLRQFREHGPVVCTDDGSDGFHGNTVQYLESLERAYTDRAALYTCGPHPMLKGCHLFAQNRGISCQVSMEQTMACGVGACMGCVEKTNDGYVRVCQEGPVFESRVIEWA